MPQNKDLKRVVRTRMAKTGESYTAAREQIIRKSQNPVEVASEAAAPLDYAALAGQTDATMVEKTGRSWTEWTRELDGHGASALKHGEIVAILTGTYGIPGWWSQTVAVGYERIKGLRAKGQRLNGDFDVSKSRTYNVPVEVLFAAWFEDELRRTWLLDVEATPRSVTAPKLIRLQLTDGTRVVCWFSARSGAKSVVALQHEKLPDAEAADMARETWSRRLDRLAGILAGT